MAQYQRNFYGSSYYGETNAFSGSYETAEILTEEPLNNTFTVSITATLPSVTYGYNAPEVEKTIGTWTPNVGDTHLTSNSPSAKLTFIATCDRIVVKYQARPDGTNINVRLTTTVPGEAAVVNMYTFSSNEVSISNKEYVLENLPYGSQKLELYLDTVPSGKFYFKDITARVCGFTIETRARTGAGLWSAYSKVNLTNTLLSGNKFKIEGTSLNYGGMDRVQVRVWMASSDNTATPEIEQLDTYAGDINNRTEDGSWSAIIDMNSVAAAVGKTFAEITGLDWTSTEPANTRLTLRTRASNEVALTRWTAWTIPYTKTTKRLRLKEGSNEGYVITPLINPASINPNLRIDHWVSWNDRSHLPPDESSVRVLYEFLDEKDAVMYRVDQPKYMTDRGLLGKPVGSKPYRLKITLSKRLDKSSPAVELLQFTSNLIYEERKITQDYGFSAVNNSNTGEDIVLDMSVLTFNAPAEANAPTYYLEDQTQRPRDVLLYLDSTKNLPPTISRPNFTSLANDKVWARVNVDNQPTDSTVTGVFKHYQYGGGSAVLSQPDELAIASAFTPALDTSKEYRFFLLNGWMDAATLTIRENTENDHVAMFWKSEEPFPDKTQVTEYSSHNALVKGLADTSGDMVYVEVTEASTMGIVDWVSEEKIYAGKVNLNDERDDYIRKHTTPESGDSLETKYRVQNAETYAIIADKFSIDEADLREENGDVPLIEGMTIIIPARIVLPAINPAAIVSANPYEVTIVHNSVKQGGKVVDNSRVTVRQLLVEEEEVTITKEKVIRGSVAHGRDVLANAKITQVIGIWDSINDPIQAVDYQANLDYVVEGNYISWSPSDGMSTEPTSGAEYYVSYKCMRPKSVTIVLGCDYQEEGGVNRVWRSPEVKEFSGTCAPGLDHKAALPAITTWEGTGNPDVEDLEFIIEDNDLWVKTWVEYDSEEDEYYAIGSLQDRIPKDNWLPYIKTGYYYVGKDEFYLFSEPIVVEPDEAEVARSENIIYTTGKYNNAARFSKQSKNYIRNSGFEVQGSSRTVQKISFGSGGVAMLGITN